MQKLLNTLFILAGVLVLASLLGFHDATARKPWPMVGSAEARHLKFSHAFHLDEAGAACADCHEAASTSKSGEDDLLPTHAECAKCHSVDDQNQCSMCHLDANPVGSPRVSGYSAKFNHELHAGQAELECNVCHQDLDGKLDAATAGHFPTMTACMQCHTDKLVANDCSRCHEPDDELRPRDHHNDWVRLHGMTAADGEDKCNQCHTATSIAGDCQSCHAGDQIVHPHVHPRNYVFRHGQDAHLSDMRCATCHEQRDFCAECHTAMNVLPAGHYRPGWLTATGGEHGQEAEFDLESCMSCHDRPHESPVCATCHTE